MKLITKWLVLVALLIAPISPAQDAKDLTSKIANALGYPAERLLVEDKTLEYAENTKGKSLFAIKLSSKNGGFTSTVILVTQSGGMLSEDLAKWGDAQIASGSASIRRFEMSQGAYGYSGLGMVGAGGSVERILATWPTRQIDLQIQITIPREGVEFDESTKSYHELMMNGGPQLAGTLMKCMEQLAQHVERADIRSTNITRQPEPSSTPSPTTQSTQPPRSPPTAPAPQSTTPSGELTLSTPWSIIVVLIVAAIGLLWLLLKRRS